MSDARKEQREKRKDGAVRRAVCCFSLFTLLFALTSCGFQLRGTDHATLPPALSVMRMGGPVYSPLAREMRNVLREQAGVTVTEDIAVPAPTLTLSGEYLETQVLAIDVSGKVSDYLLNYRVSFSLTDATGSVLIPMQTVKLQREYTFDKLSVLAKEKEDEFLRQEMQRDAVQQILRRLASLRLQE